MDKTERPELDDVELVAPDNTTLELQATQQRLAEALQVIVQSRNWFSLIRLTVEGLRLSSADPFLNATALLVQVSDIERWSTAQETRLGQPITPVTGTRH